MDAIADLRDCRHRVLILAPASNEIVTHVRCHRCDVIRSVFRIMAVFEWRAKCNRCAYSRRFGADETTCRRRAQEHAHRFPSHTLSVGTEVVAHD